MAAKNDHAAVIKNLLEARTDVNAQRNGGQTPVFDAAFSGAIAALRVLLQSGGDATVASTDGTTPQEAVCSCQLESDSSDSKCPRGQCNSQDDKSTLLALFSEVCHLLNPL